MSSSFNCPNCGASLNKRLDASKIIVCDYCSGTIVLEDDALRYAGECASVIEEASIFRLHQSFLANQFAFTPIGKIQFSYNHGKGLWEEWWCEVGDAGIWVSVDEGDIAIQEPDAKPMKRRFSQIRLGEKIKFDDAKCVITEVDTATVEAFTGELPEPVNIGDTYGYAHAEGPGGLLYTIEADGESCVSYRGHWIDPYSVKAV